LGIDRIEVNAPRTGFRDNTLNVSSEHRLFTRMELLHSSMGNIRTERNRNYLLNYSVEPIYLNELEGAIPANRVEITYSTSITSSYEFDAEVGVFRRYVNGRAHADFVTGTQLTFKNIITYQVANYHIGEGRQSLSNIGNGTGYFITNGYAVPITWEKASRSARTIYRFKDGTEINVNDGNTFIQIQPRGQRLLISE